MRKYAGTWKFIIFTVAFLPPIALSHLTMILKEKGLAEHRGPFAESYLRGLVDGFNSNKSSKWNLASPN